jgi:hypothetical protein
LAIQIGLLAALLVAPTASTAQAPAAAPASAPAPQGTELDLSKAFHTHSAWRLEVTEGPPTQDYGDNDAPGALTLCLRRGSAGPCVSGPATPPLDTTPSYYPAWEPHYLRTAKVVYPRGPRAAPLLLIVTGSLYAGHGDQIIANQLVAYDARQDAFRRVYTQSTGRNNNQEVRLITEGPLKGSVISAEPQDHLPYGYWIVVKRLTPAGAYRQVLRYPSATLYNDGNPLAVIDSEMPNIEERLGLWRPGQPLPLPDQPCPKPSLRHTELWCG